MSHKERWFTEMWQFIISGYVPGTDVQISFDILATFVLVTLSVFLIWLLTYEQLYVMREVKRHYR